MAQRTQSGRREVRSRHGPDLRRSSQGSRVGEHAIRLSPTHSNARPIMPRSNRKMPRSPSSVTSRNQPSQSVSPLRRKTRNAARVSPRTLSMSIISAPVTSKIRSVPFARWKKYRVYGAGSLVCRFRCSLVIGTLLRLNVARSWTHRVFRSGLVPDFRSSRSVRRCPDLMPKGQDWLDLLPNPISQWSRI